MWKLIVQTSPLAIGSVPLFSLPPPFSSTRWRARHSCWSGHAGCPPAAAVFDTSSTSAVPVGRPSTSVWPLPSTRWYIYNFNTRGITPEGLYLSVYQNLPDFFFFSAPIQLLSWSCLHLASQNWSQPSDLPFHRPSVSFHLWCSALGLPEAAISSSLALVQVDWLSVTVLLEIGTFAGSWRDWATRWLRDCSFSGSGET